MQSACLYITPLATVVGCGYIAQQTVHYAIKGLDGFITKPSAEGTGKREEAKKTIEKIGYVIGLIIGIWVSMRTVQSDREILLLARKAVAISLETIALTRQELKDHAEECFLKWGVIEEKITEMGRLLILSENNPLPTTTQQLAGFGISVAERVSNIISPMEAALPAV